MIECSNHCGTFRADHQLLICRPTGVLTNERAQDLFVCQKCLREKGLLDANRFHDLTGVTGMHLHFQDISALTKEEGEIRKGHRLVKACYLVPNDAIYGVVRMYQTLIENYAVVVHISRNLSDLAKVLDLDERELITDQALPG